MSKSVSIPICLIASGVTSWRENHRMQGRSDLPLSEAGKNNVIQTASTWTPPPDARWIFCAPDEASRQTSDLFAQRMVSGRVKAIKELQEIGMGLWEGQTEQALADRYPKAYGQWLENPQTVSVPEGESVHAAFNRLLTCTLKLARKPAHRPLILALRPQTFLLLANWLGATPPIDVSKGLQTCCWIFQETTLNSLQTAIKDSAEDHRRISA